MERSFLSQKEVGGRGVKEKQQRSVNIVEKDMVVVSSPAVDEPVEATMNTEDVNVRKTPTSPTVNPILGTSYANLFSARPSRKAMNFCTFFTPRGNGVDVVVPVESFRAISARFANTLYRFFLGKRVAYPVDGLSVIATKLGTPLMLYSYTSDMCIQSWGRSSYARAMIEVWADVELKDTIMVAMPKLTRDGFYMCNVRVEYEWKPPRCACCKVFGHVQDKFPNNIDSDVVKNMKKPSQTPRGVSVGPKVGFKQVKQVYQQVARKNQVNTNGNKKKDVEPTIEVSNSNLFDVLNSVENDVDLGTNGGSPNLASRKANTSGFLSGNVESSSTSNTPMVEKIDKMERLIIERKVTLVNDEGKPLKKVYYSGDHDSEDEVAIILISLFEVVSDIH
ncbi:hypothetical protein Tco_1308290 [Tanacetum coccineum]